MKDVIWGIVNEAGKINLVDVFPILENIDPQRIRYRTSIHFAKLFKLFGDLINERLKETKKNHSAENPREMDENYIKSTFLQVIPNQMHKEDLIMQVPSLQLQVSSPGIVFFLLQMELAHSFVP